MSDFYDALAGLLGPAGEGLVCTDGDNIVFMSERAKSLLGADFTGAAASTLFDADALALARGDVVSARLNGRPFTVSAAEYGGLKMYYLVSLLVPGEYISLSALDEAMVRDNLGTLHSAADRALQGADNRAIRGYLEAVKHSSALIERALVNSSLLGRLSCGDEPMHSERIELGSFLSDLTDPVIGFAVARGVTLELSAEPGLWLLADKDLLATMLLELLGHCLTHLGGDGRVLVTAGRRGGMIAVNIGSNGAGTPPDGGGLRLASMIAIALGGSLLSSAGDDGAHLRCTLPPYEGDAALESAAEGVLSPAQAFNRAAVQLSPWLRPEDYDYRLFEVD